MRTLTVTCDCGCGATNVRGRERSLTWWVLEDHGRTTRTGAMDFATLACLTKWVTDNRVRNAPVYAPDFQEATGQQEIH